MQDTLTSFIIDLPEYFHQLGYRTPAGFQETFFEVYGRLSPKEISSFRNFEALEPFIEPMVTSSVKEHEHFHQDYINYVKDKNIIIVPNDKAKELKSSLAQQKNLKARQEQLSESIESRRRTIHKMEEKIKNHSGKVIKDRTETTYEKQYKEIEKEMKKIFSGSKHKEKILSLHKIASDEKTFMDNREIDEIREELKKGLKKAIKYKSAQKIMKYLEKQSSLLNKMKQNNKPLPDVGKEKRKLEEEERRLEQARADLDKLLEKIRQEAKTIKKTGAKNHRSEFVGRNFVQTSLPDGVLEKTFKSLSKNEKQQIREYIEDNAKKFKTRISRNIHSGNKHKIDLPGTIKRACMTNGIPIDLQFVKPKRNRAKLIMFLDVSGSCKEASEMMLTFMHEMKDAFSGGCRTYVFVNSLFDVSEIFEESMNAEESVTGILNSIPRRGVYSDYYRPLKDFRENHFSKINKDSLVFFIGDARNNANPTGEEYIKAISRRAKKTYWMNTDIKDKWNQGDSVIGKYAPYMDTVTEVRTTQELLAFLLNAR